MRELQIVIDPPIRIKLGEDVQSNNEK